MSDNVTLRDANLQSVIMRATDFNGVKVAHHIQRWLGGHVTDSFIRPNDTNAYTAADLVANSTTAGSVVALAFDVVNENDQPFMIAGASLKKTGTSITNAQFRIHLFGSSPTIANGDNAAFSTTESNHLGSIDILMDKAFTDGAKGHGTVNKKPYILRLPASGTKRIYGLIEALAAYTPVGNETFTCTLEVSRGG